MPTLKVSTQPMPIGRLFGHRYGNAVLMGLLTAIADAWSHPGRFEVQYGEALLTGVVSGLIVLAVSFLVEDRARRVRSAWAWMRGERTNLGERKDRDATS